MFVDLTENILLDLF